MPLATNQLTPLIEQSLSMQAIAQRSYGSAAVLQRATLKMPTIAKTDVLLEVHAAALDQGTWHLMTGTPYLLRVLGFGFLRPKQQVPGLDVAGIVKAVGSEVTRFVPGDEVYGIARGSFAEYAAASEDKLVTKPTNLSFKAAAAVTVSGITALEALTDQGKLQAGQQVLIVGASGGVGSYAVQLAKALGATVTAVASASKADLVRGLGADHVIDYRTNYLVTDTSRYDLIVDIGGRSKVSQLRRMLTREGTLVFVGGEGGNRITGGIGRQLGAALISPFVHHNLKMFVSGEKRSIMERLKTFIQTTAVTPSIGQEFALDDVAVAMERLQAGKLTGKAVLTLR